MVQFRRDWLTQIDMMQREMDRLLDHLAGSKPPRVRFAPSAWEPAIDVYETNEYVVVTVELAGIRESDMEIMIANNTFTIRGERKKTLRASGKRAFHRLEITTGPFERSITLPAAIDATNSKASYEDGLVEVVLPKAGKGGTRTIKIKTG